MTTIYHEIGKAFVKHVFVFICNGIEPRANNGPQGLVVSKGVWPCLPCLPSNESTRYIYHHPCRVEADSRPSPWGRRTRRHGYTSAWVRSSYSRRDEPPSLLAARHFWNAHSLNQESG